MFERTFNLLSMYFHPKNHNVLTFNTAPFREFRENTSRQDVSRRVNVQLKECKRHFWHLLKSQLSCSKYLVKKLVENVTNFPAAVTQKVGINSTHYLDCVESFEVLKKCRIDLNASRIDTDV